MITLSDSAREELDAYFNGKEKSSLRIYLAPGGCSGPRMALALDTPMDDDASFETNGYSFCINKELLADAKEVSIDLSDYGFVISSQLASSGGGCSPSCCSGCSGGCAS